MFGRSAKPIYPYTNEEFTDKIESELYYNDHIIYKNDSPYDIRYNNGQQIAVKTDHLTFFYRQRIYPHILGQKIKEFLDKGYSVIEHANDLKSINIPHLHFVKIINAKK